MGRPRGFVRTDDKCTDPISYEFLFTRLCLWTLATAMHLLRLVDMQFVWYSTGGCRLRTASLHQYIDVLLHLALGLQAQVARYGNNNKDVTSSFVYVGLLRSGSARTSPGTGILRGDR